MNPPTLASARRQFPKAEVVQPSKENRVFYVDGCVTGWWVWSTDNYQLMPVLLIALEAGGEMLIERVAVDPQLEDIVYGGSYGRYAFIAIKDVVVMLGFQYDGFHNFERVNLTSELRRIHKSAFSFGLKWPSHEAVEAELGEYRG